MPDFTSTSYYRSTKFSDIRQTPQKNLSNFDESSLDFVRQFQWSKPIISSLNGNRLERRSQTELNFEHCQICQKELNQRQLQNSHTFGTDISLHEIYSCPCYPDEIFVHEKPNTENINKQNLKCAALLSVSVKPSQNYVTGEPADGSSTSKSSSSCDGSDTWHSTARDMRSQGTKGSRCKEISNNTSECQNKENKAQEKGSKLWEHQERNSNCCAHRSQLHFDENLRQTHKLLNSGCIKCHSPPDIDSSKPHIEKLDAGISNIPHTSALKKDRSVRLESIKQKLTKPTCQSDISKYDDKARSEIFKLRQRIKRYTDGSDSSVPRKSPKFRTHCGQSMHSSPQSILKFKKEPIPECRSNYRDSSYSERQLQCTKHSPLIRKCIPPILHKALVRKKKRDCEVCDQLLETETASCTTLSDESDRQTRKHLNYRTNMSEPHWRNRDVQCPSLLSTSTNEHGTENGCCKSIPRNTPAKNKVHTTEHFTNLRQRNCQLSNDIHRKNQFCRPVPGERPLYNYDELPYQASEVYPELIYELEQKLSTIHGSGKSPCAQSKQSLKKNLHYYSGK